MTKVKRPFANIGFSFGAALFVVNALGVEAAKYAAILLLAMFAAIIMIPKYREKTAVAVCVGSALFACVLFLYAYYTVALPQLSLGGKSSNAVFYLTSLGEKSGSGYTYTAKVVSLGIDGAPQGIKVRLYTSDQIPVAGYQLVEGRLNFMNAVDNGFSSYGGWGKGIFLNAKVSDYNATDEFIRSPMTKILEIRYRIISAYTSSVGGDEGALAAGFLIGDRSGLSDELTDAFKTAGATHLTAVSGLHLSAVTGVFLYLFKKSGVSAKASSPVILLIIAFYCALSGFSKSVVRSGIMLAVMLIGAMMKRRADSLNSLGLALFIICSNPFAVCDIATLLTTLSVLAIITLYPILSERRNADSRSLILKHGDGIKPFLGYALDGAQYLRNMLLLSLAISLCCMPVSCVFFGYFSVIGILLNVILVPLGSIVITLNFLSTLFVGAGIAAAVVRFANGIIIKLIMAATKVPFAVLNITPVFAYVLFGVLLTAASYIIVKPKKVKRAAVLTIAVLAVAVIVFGAYDRACSHIYITSNGAVAVCSSDRVEVVGADNEYDCRQLNSFLSRRYKKVDIIYTSDAGAVQSFAAKYGCSDMEELCDNYVVDVDGVTFAAGDNSRANIVLVDSTVYDKNGEYELYDGGLLYTVNDGTYTLSSY